MVDERSREVRSVIYSHRKKLRVLVVTSWSERRLPLSIFQMASHIEMGEGRKFFHLLAPQPTRDALPRNSDETRSWSEGRAGRHPSGVLSADLALQNLDRRDGFRCWWPLALHQTQEHVDAIGVETLPTFVIWRMAMAAAIHPACLLQILRHACRLRRADVNLLLVETTQEMARHSDTLPRGSGSVPFFNQVIPQF